MNSTAECRRSFIIPANHPAFAGHFPGRPIVPGVVILDCVLESVTAEFGGDVGVTMPAVKFLRVVTADEAFEVIWTRHESEVSFRCDAGDGPIAEGRLQFTARP